MSEWVLWWSDADIRSLGLSLKTDSKMWLLLFCRQYMEWQPSLFQSSMHLYILRLLCVSAALVEGTIFCMHGGLSPDLHSMQQVLQVYVCVCVCSGVQHVLQVYVCVCVCSGVQQVLQVYMCVCVLRCAAGTTGVCVCVCSGVHLVSSVDNFYYHALAVLLYCVRLTMCAAMWL